MACLQTLKGIPADCVGSIGGIKKIWMANADDIALPTPTEGDADTYALAAADEAKFKEYDTQPLMSSLTSTFTKGDNAQYWANELVLQFKRMTPAKHAEIDALANASLAIVVLDKNGQYWFITDATMSGGGAQTGQGLDDLNGYNPTFSSQSAELPYALASFTPAQPAA